MTKSPVAIGGDESGVGGRDKIPDVCTLCASATPYILRYSAMPGHSNDAAAMTTVNGALMHMYYHSQEMLCDGPGCIPCIRGAMALD